MVQIGDNTSAMRTTIFIRCKTPLSRVKQLMLISKKATSLMRKLILLSFEFFDRNYFSSFACCAKLSNAVKKEMGKVR